MPKVGGSAPAELIPASSDASFRRYFRWQGGDRSLVVMDAPPPQEDCRPFVKVAGLLAGAGVHVPRILAQDLENGFLLLSDLGRQTYLDVLHPGNADELFEPALDALIAFQKVDVAGVLPAYDEAVLRRELQLFPTGTWPVTWAWSWRARRWPAGSGSATCWYAARWSSRGCSSIATICRAT